MRRYLNDKYVKMQLETVVNDLFTLETIVKKTLPYLENRARENPEPELIQLISDIKEYRQKQMV